MKCCLCAQLVRHTELVKNERRLMGHVSILFLLSSFRTFAHAISAPPYCAPKFTLHVMHRARAK